MNTSTRARSEGGKTYHFPPYDNCNFCRDRHSDTRVDPVERQLVFPSTGEQSTGCVARVGLFFWRDGKQRREQTENWAEAARNPALLLRHGSFGSQISMSQDIEGLV
jgi:hypothetical protein